ncbi:hippocalcin-like protein 1 [Mizuhopecten yessoensis]|uniref:Hippocalcin-like protein 1 n=1 Tax=Mizuhopecten yessoensis TaxID=6573 RepID=A0A210PDH7_MIZYE|nr:hippocalcin-like protein 1 [Mizuhopecten yessoensis]XP_021351586.1 hippocalcin-like protein 1 [Mizuhopecten yessoensis]OWF34549.1 Hippocalcin-like protein 1 [Mizuhopecten yessoensis]OWF56344.1 Hippocalcin-like protein 1 [Mizuhopecten yessoensis]
MGNKSSLPSPRTMKELRAVLSDEYTNEEILGWFEQYKASLSRGESKLTMEAFIRVYSRLFEGEASNFAEQVFRVFDTDGNGVVDFKEFMMGIYVSGSPLEEDMKLDWAFKMYDMNGDGYITKDEMKFMFTSICRMTLAQISGNNSTPEELTDYFFERFDEDNDNRISNKEFVSRARNHREIIHMLEINPCPDD